MTAMCWAWRAWDLIGANETSKTPAFINSRENKSYAGKEITVSTCLSNEWYLHSLNKVSINIKHSYSIISLEDEKLEERERILNTIFLG